MDELRAVRELRADAPRPDAPRLAHVRGRFLEEIDRPRRRPALRWTVAGLGAAVAVTVVALLTTLLPGKEPARPAERPRADQWLVHKTRMDGWRCGYVGSGGGWYLDPIAWELNLGWGPKAKGTCTPERRLINSEDRWMRYDGRLGGMRDRALASADELSPQKSDALMAELPEDDARAVLRLIRKRTIPTRVTSAWRKTQAQRDYDEIVEVLAGAPTATPDQRRILYEVIAGLDGATKPVTTTDGIGRKVIAIGVEGHQRDYAWERNTYQVLLDPETYAYRGVRVVAGMGYYVDGKASGGPFVAKGTVIATVTRESTRLSDTPPPSRTEGPTRTPAAR
ncbi:hypothetical protein ACFPM3_31265 [Streptomyces coeruleoprunus]|uniref:CU044_5270 family protein n=1 Tax=Streptomyces coeruleoprunus TaxID=285563 RepID=A0ABV9XNC6_9ACTN